MINPEIARKPEMKEKCVTKHLIYDGSFLKLREDQITSVHGAPCRRVVLEHHGGVGVVPLDDQNRIVLVKQYRYAVGEVVLEIPAGKLELGEDPLACGKRELIEETGFSGANFTDLGTIYPTPGYSEEILYIYLATGLTQAEKSFDADEYLENVVVTLEKAVEMVMSGEIKDAKSQIGILKTAFLLGNAR